jgi:hypothetical protein
MLVVGGIAAFSSVAEAQDGTPAQRNACKQDVFRLCSEYIPDRGAITACLQRNVGKLSPDCRTVFQRKQ